jgi:hypothetical protein
MINAPFSRIRGVKIRYSGLEGFGWDQRRNRSFSASDGFKLSLKTITPSLDCRSGNNNTTATRDASENYKPHRQLLQPRDSGESDFDRYSML